MYEGYPTECVRDPAGGAGLFNKGQQASHLHRDTLTHLFEQLPDKILAFLGDLAPCRSCEGGSVRQNGPPNEGQGG